MIFGVKSGMFLDFDDAVFGMEYPWKNRIDNLKTLSRNPGSSGGGLCGTFAVEFTYDGQPRTSKQFVIVPHFFPSIESISGPLNSFNSFGAYTDPIDNTYHEVLRIGNATFIDGSLSNTREYPSHWTNLGTVEFRFVGRILILSNSSNQYYQIITNDVDNIYETSINTYVSGSERNMFTFLMSTGDSTVRYVYWPNTLIRSALNTIRNIEQKQSELYVSR